MEDSNLIACLYPADGDPQTEVAIRMRENGRRFIPAQRPSASEHGSRETTVSSDEENDNYNPNTQPGLQLTFNLGPKAGQGFVIGHDRNRCDIVLPRLNDKISRHHCVLTFDTKRRLILRSLSTNGTIVEYDGKGGEKRRTIVTKDNKGREKRHHFTWILSGGEADKVKKIVIQIQDIRFRINVSKHKAYPDLYNDYVDRFIREANADDELPFGALGIQSTASTAQQSGAHTPTPQTPIYINQWRLGSGQFSIVSRVWDVSTGLVYASKEFFNMKESQWKKEGSIMSQVSQLSNEHIVQFIALIERPSPQLILEYLPLGNLEDQHKQQPFSDQESLTILCQGLNVLTSIHENNIVHRDIKPENILIQSREPLHIKFADFGLSKATADLQTFCGTHLYAAPEIYATRRGTYYTKACDIWSFGVVVFEYAYGPLPKFDDGDAGLRWCKKIIKRVNDWDSDILLDFLSTAMLVIKPEGRFPTRKCWEQALRLSAPFQSRCATPTQASYSARDYSKEIPDIYRATPSATPTEVATFVTMEALRNRKPSMQEANTALSQATGDHYLIGCDTEEQALKDQRSLVNSSKEGITRVRKARKMKRKTDLVPSPRERRSNTPTCSTRHSSSTVQRSKRTRLEGRGLSPQYPSSIEATDLFGTNRLRDPNCVGSDVAALGDDVDERSLLRSRLLLPQASKNLSTRSLRFDREGIVYVVIRRQAVGMRISDYKLNASQICNAADLNKSDRRKYLRILKSRDIVTVEKRHCWVPFQDGVFLCQALKLDKELNTLFSKASMNIPLEEENYFLSKVPQKVELLPKEYAILQRNEVEIVYNPSKQTINATHLIKLGNNINRATLANFLNGLETPKTVIRGNSKAQGSYISFEDARKLCQHFGLSQDPIEKLLARVVPAPAIGPVVDAALCTLDNDLVANEDEYWRHSPAAPTSMIDGTRPTSYDGATHYDYTYNGSFSVESLGDRKTRSAAPLIPRSDLPTNMECEEAVADPDRYSQYTESNYERGSYLAPTNRSYLQLCMDNTA